MSDEEWRSIEGLPNYEVSSLGNVRSLNYRRTGRIQNLSPNLNPDGYYYVNFTGKSKTIHRLVCSAFHPNPESKPEVDHINRNKQDNRAENLRWATSIENRRNQGDKDAGISGEINISVRYEVRCRRTECPLSKSCKSLEEAIEVRNNHFKKK